MKSSRTFVKFWAFCVVGLGLTLLVYLPKVDADRGKLAVLDLAKIEAAAQGKGVANEIEGVFKISYPRKDVKVKVDGTVLPPFMGLTSWVAFKAGDSKDKTMVMGDLVLFEDEVNPVMSVALDGGLAVTGLHNHFFFCEPPVYFMHVGGEGDGARLAAVIGRIHNKVRSIRTGAQIPARSFGRAIPLVKSSISSGTIEQILGVKTTGNNGMVKAVIGQTARMPDGMEAGGEMGINTWAAFAGTSRKAIIDGDFVTTPKELQIVLKSLRAGGINVVAIHNHMVDETPRLIFLHYWGRGAAADLARAFRSALDAQAKAAREGEGE